MAETANELSQVDDMTVVKTGSAHIWKSPMWIKRMELLLNNELMSDITFIVKGERFHAHKFVLSFASEVFYAMFYGTMAGDQKEIEIVDCENPEDFLQFLSMIYKKSARVTWDNVSQLSYLSKKYMIMETGPFSNFIKSTVGTSNCLEAFDISIALEEADMIKECLRVIQKDVRLLVMTQRFLELKQPSLKEILKQDMLNIKEIDLFFAVDKWCSYQVELQSARGEESDKREVLGDALHEVRFPLIELKDFTTYCRPSQILTNKEMVDVYHTLVLGTDKSDSSSIRESDKENEERNEASSLDSANLTTTFISRPRLKGNVFVCMVDDENCSIDSLLDCRKSHSIALEICVSRDAWLKGLKVVGLGANSISVGTEQYDLKIVGGGIVGLDKPFFMKAMVSYNLSYSTTLGKKLNESLPLTLLCNDFKCYVRNCGSGTVSKFSHLIFSTFDGEAIDGAIAQLPNMKAIRTEEILKIREPLPSVDVLPCFTFGNQTSFSNFGSQMSTASFVYSSRAPGVKR